MLKVDLNVFDGVRVFKVGDIIKFFNLVKIFCVFVVEGKKGFYIGCIVEEIVKVIIFFGGYFILEDLEYYLIIGFEFVEFILFKFIG